MPPTSIDGTDITGATIDGTDVQEITVDGQTVFTSTTFIDDFEVGNLSNYDGSGASGDLSEFAVQSSTVHTGSFALEMKPGGPHSIFSDSPGGGITPAFGEDFEFYFQNPTGNSPNAFILWLSDTSNAQVGVPTGFSINFKPDQILLREGVSGDFNQQQTSFAQSTLPTGTWLRIEVTYPGNQIKAELFDEGTSLGSGSITPAGTGSGSHIAFTTLSGSDSVFVDDWALL